MNLKVPEI